MYVAFPVLGGFSRISVLRSHHPSIHQWSVLTSEREREGEEGRVPPPPPLSTISLPSINSSGIDSFDAGNAANRVREGRRRELLDVRWVGHGQQVSADSSRH